VLASAPDGSGGWYIAGLFTEVGGQTRNRLARINADGSLNAWNPNANATVRAMVFSGGIVYIGGNFTTVAGQAKSYIAALDAATGTLVPGWGAYANNVVTCLAMSNNILYAGSYFSFMNAQPRNSIAAINAATGAVTSWNPAANSSVSCIAANAGSIYAGGAFTNMGGQARNYIAAIDAVTGSATSWNPGADSHVYGLALDNNTVYAGGAFNFIGGQSRNYLGALDATTGLATTWNPNPNATVMTVQKTGNTVYLGGDFTTIGSVSRNFAASVDATTAAATNWDPLFNNTVFTFSFHNNNVFVGGNFLTVGMRDRTRLAAIDLTTGQLTSWNPSANALVRTLEASGSTIYAGGDFTNVNGQARARLAALDLAGTLTSWNPGADHLVYCLKANANTIYAGGDFWNVGGAPRNRFAAINVTTGAVTPLVLDANYGIVCMRIVGNTMYAGGGFTNFGGLPRNNLAAFDLTTGAVTSWNPTANNTITSMEAIGNTMYVAGYLSSLGGQGRGNLGAVDLTSGALLPWNPEADGAVYTIAKSGNNIYVGGDFTYVGGLTRNHIAALDASTGNATAWDPNANNAVNVLLANGKTMYTGGIFTAMGGNGSRSYLMPVIDSTIISFSPAQITSLSPASSLCKGGDVVINFTASGHTAGNVFTAQLSNATGSFATPVNIGTLISTSGGAITATLPTSQASGTAYRIRIVASAPATTSADNGTNLSVNTVPVSSQSTISPAGTQTICGGTTVALTIPATTGYTYQWRLNGSPIPGATTTTYTTGTAGLYRAGVINAAGCVRESANKQLNVGTPVSVTISPATAQTICNGQTVTFTTTAGTGYSYQWAVDGVAVPGATSTVFTASATGNVTVTNTVSGCSATSAAIAVAVSNCTTPPAITSLTPVLSLCQNAPVNIAFAAGGMQAGNVFTAQLSNSSGSFTSPVTIGTLTANATSGVINATIPAGQAIGSGYRIRIISSLPATTGAVNGTNLVINAMPVSSAATVSPAGTQTTCANTGAVLSVPLTAGNTYQWRIGGAAILGATSNAYTAAAAGIYTTVVSNANGCSRTSSNKTVNVNQPPAATITPSATQNICSGQMVTLTANTGTGITHQWLLNGGAIGEATAASYTATTSGSYTVTTTRSSCSATSAAVVLTSNCSAVITSTGAITRCNGDTLSIAFTSSAQSGNVYTLQLSDAAGSFSNPVSIGTLSGTGSGIITGTVPAGTAPGVGYKLRINGSNPATFGTASALTLSVLDAIAPVSLCAVTVDPVSGKNMLVWNKPVVNTIDTFILYRSGTAAGQMVGFGAQAYAAFSTFTDVATDPSVMAMQYAISARNNCGETVVSAAHKTMHLTINKGQNNNTWNLIWNGYQGVTHGTYNIWRGATAGTMTVIMQIPAGSYNSFTDNAAPTGNVFYMVTVADGPSCIPSARTTGGGDWISSNIATNSGVASASWTDISIFPNPSGGAAEVLIQSSELKAFSIVVRDITGKVAARMETESNKLVSFGSTLSPGIYLVEAIGNDGRKLIRKWIKE
jgi:predicted small secreted protein